FAVALHCLGFPSERLAYLARASGLPLWSLPLDSVHAERPPVESAVVLLLGHGWEDQLSQYWDHPYSAWIEVASLADQSVLELIKRATDSRLYASFTTLAANKLDLAGEMMVAIGRLSPLSETIRDNIELALHEALCNALLHGNLQLESIGALSIEALERFSSELMGRITDPRFANRRIDVVCDLDQGCVVIDVVDQGGGFVPKPKAEPKASGRGFALIGASCESFRLLDGGRRVSMRFPL
ncbi:MAG: ATP-binding protein, partial [Rhodospirillaceae bacterium]